MSFSVLARRYFAITYWNLVKRLSSTQTKKASVTRSNEKLSIFLLIATTNCESLYSQFVIRTTNRHLAQSLMSLSCADIRSNVSYDDLQLTRQKRRRRRRNVARKLTRTNSLRRSRLYTLPISSPSRKSRIFDTGYASGAVIIIIALVM